MWPGRTYLKESGEDVELKNRDVVVAGEVDGGFERHGFQTWTYGVELVESLTEHPPGDNGPGTEGDGKLQRSGFIGPIQD